MTRGSPRIRNVRTQLSIFGPKLTDAPMGGLVSVESDRARHAFLCHGEDRHQFSNRLAPHIAVERRSFASSMVRLRQGFPGLAEWLIRTAAFQLPIAAL